MSKVFFIQNQHSTDMYDMCTGDSFDNLTVWGMVHADFLGECELAKYTAISNRGPNQKGGYPTELKCSIALTE